MKFSSALVKDGISATSTFLKETRAEGKKVIWPSRQYVVAATMIILVILFLTAAYIMFVDYIFANLFTYLMRVR